MTWTTFVPKVVGIYYKIKSYWTIHRIVVQFHVEQSETGTWDLESARRKFSSTHVQLWFCDLKGFDSDNRMLSLGTLFGSTCRIQLALPVRSCRSQRLICSEPWAWHVIIPSFSERCQVLDGSFSYLKAWRIRGEEFHSLVRYTNLKRNRSAKCVSRCLSRTT